MISIICDKCRKRITDGKGYKLNNFLFPSLYLDAGNGVNDICGNCIKKLVIHIKEFTADENRPRMRR